MSLLPSTPKKRCHLVSVIKDIHYHPEKRNVGAITALSRLSLKVCQSLRNVIQKSISCLANSSPDEIVGIVRSH